MKKEIKIGIIMALSLGTMIWGINYLKGKNFFSNTRGYSVFYNDVSGLKEANGVFIKGYKVGHVGNIEFSDKTLKKLHVVLAIEKDILIPKGTHARIYSVDLMGTKAVELIYAENDLYMNQGDTLRGEVEISVSQQIEPYKLQFYNLLNSMDSLSNAILKVFNSATIKNLHASIKSITETSESIGSSSEYIKTLFENIASISENLKENNRKINNIIRNLDVFSDSLSHLNLNVSINKLNISIDETNLLLSNLKKGQGTLGKLITNDSLYYSLGKSISNLDSLVTDLKKNPKRYVQFSVFGKK
jgi:phospholipid/cholesterol/gamma-HCH transport system substrate-binding protein